ncbi:DUF956 family protein [Schleiferilactobacillus perolens]|jgi:hypothetical protein|uniref:Mano-protein n=1 Tax=Schleiferilactobacillus perolens DSM 12744 TaxID=1423792 RepID=A0A0R1MWU9_9LACO|nr:DUF956 family protein [Schleiferilactobacillus perolens]KRL12364.1 mano-protein [Schleiferilactobacillus perolens DSM 12744]MCI1892805.1 DUF956 family protein [Schleiferilactobacillus harbinensis]MCI1913782.1 DUF956 family protein [Schleiferilactobacillus harbinensis]MCI2170815.1 DUF956 family protein [Schleiferilactobacillus perolens]
MVESLNTKVELVMDATSYLGMPEYGKLMVGDKGFEFYNEKNLKHYIQIPWDEVDYVIVSILFRGKWIPRYAFKTKKAGTFSFSSKDPKRVLRAVREHVPADHIVKSLSFLQVLSRGIRNLGQRGNKKQSSGKK